MTKQNFKPDATAIFVPDSRESGFLESAPTGRQSQPLDESGRGICEGVRASAPCQIPAAFRPIGDLDMIGVGGVKISRYSSQPLLMSPAMMAEFRTFSRAY